jgi:hypothetical protein
MGVAARDGAVSIAHSAEKSLVWDTVGTGTILAFATCRAHCAIRSLESRS